MAVSIKTEISRRFVAGNRRNPLVRRDCFWHSSVVGNGRQRRHDVDGRLLLS